MEQQQGAPSPTPGHPQAGYAPVAQQRKVWPIVAVTLGGVLTLVVVFVLGVVVGVWAGRMSPAPTAGGTAVDGGGSGGGGSDGGGSDGGGSGGGGAGGGGGDEPVSGFDDCLVGTWRTVEHSEQFDLKEQGGVVTLSELDRQIEFTADGTETISYDSATAQVDGSGQASEIVFDGTVVYQVGADGSEMSFELVSVDGEITLTDAEGQTETQPIQPGSGSVSYTCDDTSFVQEGPGFSSSYERVG